MPHHAFRAPVPDPYLPHTGLYPPLSCPIPRPIWASSCWERPSCIVAGAEQPDALSRQRRLRHGGYHRRHGAQHRAGSAVHLRMRHGHRRSGIRHAVRTGVQLRHPALHGQPGRKHPHPPAQLHATTRLFPRNPLRRKPLALPAGTGKPCRHLLNVAAGRYGDAAIAGMSIVGRICMFINSFLIGFGQGFQPYAATITAQASTHAYNRASGSA